MSTPDFAVYAAAYVEQMRKPRRDDFFHEHWNVVTRTVGMNVLHSHMSSRSMDMLNQLFFSYEHAYVSPHNFFLESPIFPLNVTLHCDLTRFRGG